MKYNNVSIEGVEAYLPENILSSADIETQLGEVYERLRLPQGRLELFTGIKERRYWPPGTLPSQVSTQAALQLMGKLNLKPQDIDALIHCSVCRDFLEPATASVVHSNLKLPSSAINFDISNACLGMVSGVSVLADMITSGRIKRGLVVGGEIGYPLVQKTLQFLKSQSDLTRQSIKPHFASLTIGSAAAAIIVSRSDIAGGDAPKVTSISDHASTEFNHLCQGTSDSGMGKDSNPLMHTDSEELLVRGVEAAQGCWQKFLNETAWTPQEINLVCTHQVGSAHTKLLLDSLNLEPEKTFLSYPHFGNCGSASLPLTLALAIQSGRVAKGDKVALLGIGSGINCSMVALKW